MEKSVCKTISERVARSELKNSFGRTLIPSEEVVEVKRGQKSISERRIFPGYILIEMELTDETWYLVKNIPFVTGFLGSSGNRPTPISTKEVEKILLQMEKGSEKPRPKVEFQVGETVRLKEEPFVDVNGTIEEVNYEKSKLGIAVSIFGRPTRLEFDFSQVEKT